ncbi:MAG: enoyl-CoA hydratase-related protein [Gammaproteobacteria bacterium]|nr:enoyl-CoA hydratase-related protein [Gammaproteobacteria bacterium]
MSACWRDRTLLSRALLKGAEPIYKPVVAAINGFCLAGGTELIQGTDIRIAAEHARFGLTEVSRGIIPAGGSLARLARQIPYAKAMEILLTGQHMTAQEAWRIGLVNEVVPAENVVARAREYGAMIAANAPLAVSACKEAVIRSSGVTLEEAYRIESEVSAKVMRSEDARGRPSRVHGETTARFHGTVISKGDEREVQLGEDQSPGFHRRTWQNPRIRERDPR